MEEECPGEAEGEAEIRVMLLQTKGWQRMREQTTRTGGRKHNRLLLTVLKEQPVDTLISDI